MAKILCIAAGHGGFDPGCVANGYEEKNLNLAMALKLESLMKSAGVDVVMTRTTDAAAGDATSVLEDLTNECKIANDAHADLFFCIHQNAGPESAAGAEAYIMPGNAYSAQLAQSVVKSISPMVGIHGEPVKDGSQLFVIRNTSMPAILLEVGFLTNTDQAKVLADPTEQEKLMQAVADVLIPALGGHVPEAPVPTPTPPISTPPEPPTGSVPASPEYATKAELDGVQSAVDTLQSALKNAATVSDLNRLQNDVTQALSALGSRVTALETMEKTEAQPISTTPPAKWSCTMPMDVMNDAFFIMPKVKDPSGNFVNYGDHFQLDTGAFETLVSGSDASALSLPNLGNANISGVTGSSAAYRSVITVQFGDRVFENVPCVVDPSYQALNGGLWGARWLIENGLSLTVQPKAKQVIFAEE